MEQVYKMTAKTEILTSLLKHTNNSRTSLKIIVKDSNISPNVVNGVLKNLHESRLIKCVNEQIELSSNQRVKLAIHAINQGIDVEKICKFLEWKEFENFTARVFEKNKFTVKRNFRFKASQRRWEIDVLAYIEPIIVCVDCKRWRRNWGNSAIQKIAAMQSQRTEVLAKSLYFLQQQIGLDNWEHATIFPVILSLFPGIVKLYNKVPVVPIIQLQSFLNEFQGYFSELRHFRTKLGPKISDYSKKKL